MSIHEFITHQPQKIADQELLISAAKESREVINQLDAHPLAEHFFLRNYMTSKTDGPSGYLNIEPRPTTERAEIPEIMADHIPALTKVSETLLEHKSEFGVIATSFPNSLTINHATFDGELTKHVDVPRIHKPSLACVASLTGTLEFYATSQDGQITEPVDVRAGDTTHLYNPANPDQRLWHAGEVIHDSSTDFFGDGSRISVGFVALLDQTRRFHLD